MNSDSWGRLSAKPSLSSRERSLAGLLVSSYAFGAFMLATDLLPGFVYLTALHLCFTVVLLSLSHRPVIGAQYVTWLLACGVIGWLVEYIGVHGQWLFGSYIYGDVLGPKWRGIPLVLAVNWILVVYTVAATISIYWPQLPWWAKSTLGAVVLVFLDVLIEPTAIALDFWTWAAGKPPLQNYLGWLFVGLLQCALFNLILPFTENRLAPLVLVLQIAFFAVLSVAL